jgi:hypothetical protein
VFAACMDCLFILLIILTLSVERTDQHLLMQSVEVLLYYQISS